jgi:hypothetical protein
MNEEALVDNPNEGTEPVLIEWDLTQLQYLVEGPCDCVAKERCDGIRPLCSTLESLGKELSTWKSTS